MHNYCARVLTGPLGTSRARLQASPTREDRCCEHDSERRHNTEFQWANHGHSPMRVEIIKYTNRNGKRVFFVFTSSDSRSIAGLHSFGSVYSVIVRYRYLR